MTDHRDDILAIVNDPEYRPVKPKGIAKALGLEGSEADGIRKLVKRMVKEGSLRYGPNHIVFPPAPSPAAGRDGEGGEAGTSIGDNGQGVTSPPAPLHRGEGGGGNSKKKTKHERDTLVGTFRRTDSGFGFVRPEGLARGTGRDADIFVPAKYAADAANGDTVRVRLGKLGRMGKPEGRVVDIVTRATNRFVGTYFESGGMGLVQVDGKVFANAIYVGDPGAKGVAPDDKVVLEMVRFPSHLRDGEGVIVEVLGARGMPGVDTLSIIHEFALPGPFAEDALEESRRQAEDFDESIAADRMGVARRDLTSETIITIDPATARDFDDAISLEKLPTGHWLLGVHIADVSHFVEPKTPLDREAKDRATSVYLPDRVIPMLPEVISNNLASLQPNRVRYALTARLEFAPDGVRVSSEVFTSAIKSCRRFAYEEVDEWLTARGLVKRSEKAEAGAAPLPSTPHRGKGAGGSRLGRPHPGPLPEGEGAGEISREVDALLERMFTLAMILRERRFKRGALELAMPEIEIDLDRDGRVVGAHLEQNTESHQIIEEFMLAANEAVAELLRNAGLIFLRRVHGAPDPRKLKSLTAFVSELGFKTESLESRFALQKLLDSVKGDPREHAVNYAALRAMQRAVYSPEDEGHFALASDCYCHFTSPIRRYPDLTVHRLIKELAAGEKPVQDMQALLVLGDHSSDREQRAAEAERELNKVKLLNYLHDKVGMELGGVITGVESYGLFVTGSELPAEGFVPVAALGDDYYRYDRAGHVLQGMRGGNSFRLGDPVRVAVAAVDVDRRELDFRLVGRLSRSGVSATGKGARRTARQGPAKPGNKKGPRKGGKGKKRRR